MTIADEVTDASTEARHLHPLSPVAHALQALPGSLILAWFLIGSFSFVARTWILTLALGLAMVVVVIGARFLQWKFLTFHFDAKGDLHVDSGVFQKQQRRLQLSRLQSVDVSQPLIARPFGLANTRVEVAGAGDSKVDLAFLDLAEAQELRNEMLARAAGVSGSRDSVLAQGAKAAPLAPETELAKVEPRDLLLSLLMRTSTASLLIVSVMFLTISFTTEGAGGTVVGLITGGLPLFRVVTQFLQNYNFTVAESPDGLRIRRGLTTTVASTVPPGRVHAVGFVEGWLWRRMGWVRVELNLGGTPQGDDAQSSNILLPIGSWDQARAVVSRILPGTDLATIASIPAPPRSRFRAPFQWSHVSLGADDHHVVMRRGWLTRQTVMMPHSRTQSVRVTQGPWERRLSLATFHVDSTPGPLRPMAPHIDAEQARQFAEAQVDRARQARGRSKPERWMANTTQGHPQEPSPQSHPPPEPPSGHAEGDPAQRPPPFRGIQS